MSISVILSATEQHITRFFALQTTIKATVLCEKCKINTPLTTEAHKRRRYQHVSKTEKTRNRVNGHLYQFSSLVLDNNRFPFFVDISSLPGDIKAILQFLHES